MTHIDTTYTQVQVKSNVELGIFSHSDAKFSSNYAENNQKAPNKKTFAERPLYLNQEARIQFYNKRIKGKAARKLAVEATIYDLLDYETGESCFRESTGLAHLARKYGVRISSRTWQSYLRELREEGHFKIEQTCFGFNKYGSNRYIRLYDDPAVRKFSADYSTTSLKEEITIVRKTKVVPLKEPLKEDKMDTVVKNFKPDKEDEIIDPNKWRPRGQAMKVLEENFGQGYLAQEPIIEEYQMVMSDKYPDGIKRKEMSYKFFPFIKMRRILKNQYGDKYLSWDIRSKFKQRPQKEIPTNPLIDKDSGDKIPVACNLSPVEKMSVYKPQSIDPYINYGAQWTEDDHTDCDQQMKAWADRNNVNLGENIHGSNNHQGIKGHITPEDA